MKFYNYFISVDIRRITVPVTVHRTPMDAKEGILKVTFTMKHEQYKMALNLLMPVYIILHQVKIRLLGYLSVF
jgi:hypothetical protein